jgi:hypothetical protein
MDSAILVVGAILFLVQFVAWFILPNAKQLAESSVEFSSIGDETKSKAAAHS